jgi:hypothetical protein
VRDEYIGFVSTLTVESSFDRNECLFQDILFFRESIQQVCEGLSHSEIRNVVLTYVLMITVGLSDDCMERIVRLLHAQGADIFYQFKGSDEFFGKTLLHFPIEDPNILEYLLGQKVNPNLQDKDGNTALHCAAQRGDLEDIKILLAYNADPTIENQANKTPRHIFEDNKAKVESKNGLKNFIEIITELQRKEYARQQQTENERLQSLKFDIL